MAEKKDILRETDDEARLLARKLVRQARHAAIAVLNPETGDPMASRVLTGTDADGAPVILISALAPHMSALAADPRASLLFGEVGKGDPLAHARITVKVRAERIADQTPLKARIRRRFLARHPKAGLYVDFPDFAFFRLCPVSASLNGGFGRAYSLTGDDLLINSPIIEALGEIEESAVNHMNSDHPDAADTLARNLGGAKQDGWKFVSMDAQGFELAHGDSILRLNFPLQISNVEELHTSLRGLLNNARKISG